ncbi:hypothetical protein SAMN05421830_10742 [Desulfomicrobium norvegicum]|uniref:O-antigen ligase domain-containing protein n=1 Tax=Desulfomicrobium norvegicum (strain DSM 1741 / NCIMB 8310) TaxID=52561 RepID=A0A8G2F7T4_DESNO|nr:hypothetical protein SAMN05421830_10742 [Desulfomicrobium norvegicum]
MTGVKKFSLERTFVILLGSYIGLSGYTYTSLNYYHLEQNDSTRSLITISLICIVLCRLIFLRSIIIPKKTLIIATPFIYMGIVGIMRSDGLEFAGAISRWLFYLLAMSYFAQPVARQHFPTLVVTLSFFFIVAGFGDLILERSLHINQAARIGGSVGSPIGFASAVYCCSISLAWIWIAKRQKLFMIAALTLCALNFATGTRSVAAGNLFALFAMWWMSTRDIGWKIVVCIVICVATAIFFDIFLGSTDVGRRIQLLLDYGSDSSFLNRDFILNIVGDRLTATDLILGVGGGRFPVWFYDNTGILNMAPHFEIIWLLVEG